MLTQLAAWTQTLHVALGAIVWSLVCALAVTAYYTARVEVPLGSGLVSGQGATRDDGVAGSSADATGAAGTTASAAGTTTGQTIRAYVALTKPRIIELLLVTTIPAMVLAARDLPGMGLGEWTWLAFWTLIGGSLAAGSANAINCYLDRDIDELMVRTRRRPLPAHQVEPERAVVFGLLLGAISLVVMAWFVNLVAAFLTLLAIAFYVVVYTIMLKRTTTQNIVIGGAAGALPPVIGWAAVTGSVALPAVILFAIVFYWTPPHFWALSLRIRKDYAAAQVPMLPVVRGVPETTRQIALYTILLVAISLVLFAVARMGPIYLGSALVLGAIFIWQAYRLWRVGTSEEALHRGRDPALPLLDHVSDPALRSGRDRRTGGHPARLGCSRDCPTSVPLRSSEPRSPGRRGGESGPRGRRTSRSRGSSGRPALRPVPGGSSTSGSFGRSSRSGPW